MVTLCVRMMLRPRGPHWAPGLRCWNHRWRPLTLVAIIGPMGPRVGNSDLQPYKTRRRRWQSRCLAGRYLTLLPWVSHYFLITAVGLKQSLLTMNTSPDRLWPYKYNRREYTGHPGILKWKLKWKSELRIPENHWALKIAIFRLYRDQPKLSVLEFFGTFLRPVRIYNCYV